MGAILLPRVIVGLLSLTLGATAALAQTEKIEYYASDAIGSIRVVFANDGSVIGRGDFTPFGEELPNANLPPERFAGQPRDPEAGLDYAVARSYQVRTGRFSSADPVLAGLVAPQLWNRYAYASNNPLSFVDPSGLNAQDPNEFMLNCLKNSGELGIAWNCGFGDYVDVVGGGGGFFGGGSSGGGGGGAGWGAEFGCPGCPGVNIGGGYNTGSGKPPTTTSPGAPAPPTKEPDPPAPTPPAPTPPLCEVVHNCDPGPVVGPNNPPKKPGNKFRPWSGPTTFVGFSGSWINFLGLQGGVGLYWQGCCLPAGAYVNGGVGGVYSQGLSFGMGQYFDGITAFGGPSGDVSATVGPVSGSAFYPVQNNQYWSGWYLGASLAGPPYGGSVGVSYTVPFPFR